MDKYLTLCFLTFCIYSSKLSNAETTPPHIIVMLADDLGWNDVSFHGSNQIPTPNIDALAYNGIILNNHYVQPLCTPSRAAFLTGKYPIHTGMQHIVLLEPEPRGLPLNETLLPEHLKKAGYDTHIVGKWHLGYHRTEYTPTRRGFDSHYGYWNGLQDYYNHNVIATFQPEMDGYDMRRNLDVDYSAKGKYSTELFADEAVSIISGHNVSKPMFLFLSHLAPHTGNIPNPLQAPDEEIAKFDHIADPNRRVYAAMVSMLDQSVGNVMKALRTKGMLDNSIILFMSDNGAPTIGVHSNKGSNFPLKGQKDSPWEGGSRGVAAVWSPLFKNMNRVSHQLMHITDWLPTFWSAAGRDTKELGNIDGISMWDVLKDNEPSPRVGFVHNIDNLIPYVSIRHGEWKYINGTTSNGAYDDIRGESGENSIEYDLKSVMQSKTANALAGFIAQKQMKEMANSHRNINVNYTLKALSANMVTLLRQEAKINCNPINATSDGANLQCNPLKSPCLFNIKDDPCETVNLADVRPIILESMQKMVAKYQESTIPPSNVPIDPLANPAYHNNVWTSWKDEVTIKSIFDSFSRSAIISFGVLCAVFILAILIVLVATLRRHNCYDKTFNAASKNGRGILFRTFSTADRRDRRRSRSRDAAMSAPVSVARRVEQFEDKDILKGRGNSQI